jgi:hypothetical protein
MITTIAIAAATGFAGLAIGTSAAGFGLRRRLDGLEDWAVEELVTKKEISEAFQQVSMIEAQREAVLAQQLSQMRAQIAQVQPVFRQGVQSGAFQQEGIGRGQSTPAPAEVNALLTQQLSGINERLQQVMSQQMPG